MDQHIRMSIYVHAVNATVGPEGLTPSMLLFGASPRLPLPNVSSMGLSRKHSFEAMWAAYQEMGTIPVQRRVATAHKHRAGPFFHPACEFCDKGRVWGEDVRK